MSPLRLATAAVIVFSIASPALAQKRDPREYRYGVRPWSVSINQEGTIRPPLYPEQPAITSETIRRTANELYVPQVSELIVKSMDCFDWLNRIDDPYLNRYKVDIEIDPQDERLKLFWKRSF